MPTWQSQMFLFPRNFGRNTNFKSEIATPLRARNDMIRTLSTCSGSRFSSAPRIFLVINRFLVKREDLAGVCVDLVFILDFADTEADIVLRNTIVGFV